MEAERKPLFRNKKKKKIVFESHESTEDNVINDASHETPEQLMTSPVLNQDSVTVVRVDQNSRGPPEVAGASAPSLPETEAGELDKRKKLFRKIYLLISGQMTLFVVMTVLFVYIPHLRKIFRKNIFDRLLLTSFIGFPLVVFTGLLVVFPSLRRKFALSGLILITSCASLLLSYIMTTDNAKSMMASVMITETCTLGSVMSTFIPRVDLTSKTGVAFFPLFMIVLNSVYPAIIPGFTYQSSIIPSVMTTLLMTHFGINSRVLLRDPSFDLKSNEYSYGVTQMYMKLGFYDSLKKSFNSRRGYTSI